MTHHCPVCKKPTDSSVHADFPFCSERCRLMDLGNWAAERYVISDPASEEGSAASPVRPEEHDIED
jgi:hypothetical protein